MNKTEFVSRIAEKSGVSKKDAEAVVKAFTETVVETVKAGDKIQLIGFGTFEASERAARDGVNPLTKEPMHIPSSKNLRFRAGKAVKEQLN